MNGKLSHEGRDFSFCGLTFLMVGEVLEKEGEEKRRHKVNRKVTRDDDDDDDDMTMMIVIYVGKNEAHSALFHFIYTCMLLIITRICPANCS